MKSFLVLLLAGAVHCYDDCVFPDQYRCGDLCIFADRQCHCGPETINFSNNWSQYCCNAKSCQSVFSYENERNPFDEAVPGIQYYGDGVCEGAVIDISAKCNEKCHLNDNKIPRSFVNYWYVQLTKFY